MAHKGNRRYLGAFPLLFTLERLRLSRKAFKWRGPNRAPWTCALHKDSFESFECLPSAVVSFKISLLLQDANVLEQKYKHHYSVQ